MAPKKRTVLKVILVGESGVGKTSLMRRYDHPEWMFIERHKVTIQADFTAKDIDVEGQQVTLMIWDTAGLERFQSLGTAFYRHSHCGVLVFDVNSSQSFQELSKWRDNFLEYARPWNPEDFPFIVLGNKVDEGEENRQVSREQAMEWCRENGNLSYFETSARDVVNIEEAFQSIAVTAMQQNRKDENFAKYGDENEPEDPGCQMCTCQ